MIETGIVALLKSSAATANTLGARIYALVLPEEFPPAEGEASATYTLVSGTMKPTLEGRMVHETRIQFDLWGERYADAANAESSLLYVLQNFAGVLNDGTRVLSCLLEMQVASYEPNARIYRRTNDFALIYIPGER